MKDESELVLEFLTSILGTAGSSGKPLSSIDVKVDLLTVFVVSVDFFWLSAVSFVKFQ